MIQVRIAKIRSMHQTFKVLIESLSPLIALLSGALVFRKSSVFLKILFVQLALWLTVYAFSYGILAFQRQHGLPLNNQVLFNWHLLIEISILCYAAWFFLRVFNARWLILIGFCAFLISWCISFYLNDSVYFANADFVASCIIAVVYGAVIYVALQQPVRWWKNAELYASSGIFLYFVASIPHISAFETLQNQFPQLHEVIFYLINDILAAIRYILLALAFWLVNFRVHE